ncbi:hypothetical protein P0Y67_22235, partial [Photobacterium sp. SP02]|uniref:hypothetical protein n=1 Tax=Photobacterium sp. SP02 TaxID=3032280 RepID=UPI003144E546
KLKKSVIAALGLSVIGGSAAYGYFYITNPYDEEYMENLEYLVKYAEKSEDKISHINWPIYLDIPTIPKMEVWDAVNHLPQIQFFSTVHSKDGYGSLYTMNLDGSDVRVLFSQEEIGGIPEIRGLSRPSRSPDGRYVISSIQPSPFNFSCVLYDLKTREPIDLGKGRCYNFNWDAESNGVYYIGGDSWQSPFYFDLNKHKLSKLYPSEDNFFEELSFENDLSGGYPIENGEFFIRKVKGDKNNLNKYHGKGFKFKLPDMKYIGVEDYFPDGCYYGQNVSADGRYFTCVYSEGGKYYYNIDKPLTKIGEVKESLIIQAGTWYMSDITKKIFRKINDDEEAPISGIYYSYEVRNRKVNIGNLAYYVPEELKENYDLLKFSDKFPPIPSVELYQETLNKILKEG